MFTSQTLDERRASNFKLLAECYYQPTRKLYSRLRDCESADDIYLDLINSIPDDQGFDSLRIDFAKLFVGPFKLLAPPYGSIYLEDKRLMRESTLDVMKYYRKE